MAVLTAPAQFAKTWYVGASDPFDVPWNDDVTGLPVDLTGKTCTFKLIDATGTTVLTAATVTGGVGKVTVDFGASETAALVAPNVLRAQATATLSAGNVAIRQGEFMVLPSY